MGKRGKWRRVVQEKPDVFNILERNPGSVSSSNNSSKIQQ